MNISSVGGSLTVYARAVEGLDYRTADMKHPRLFVYVYICLLNRSSWVLYGHSLNIQVVHNGNSRKRHQRKFRENR